MQVRRKGIVQLSSATNSTSETLAATPKAVKSAYDNAEKRLQKDQNGADIPDKGRFLNNINAVSKTDFADKRGMRYVRVNAPAGATSGKYYPVVVMRSAGSVSELASRVIITTATRTAGDPMNNCEFNGFVMPGGWTDRGRYAYGMFWQYQNNKRAIHSIMMSNKGDDLRSVFYVDGAAFPVLRLSKMACQYPHLVLISLLMIRPISLGQQIRRLNVSRRTLSLILRVGVVFMSLIR